MKAGQVHLGSIYEAQSNVLEHCFLGKVIKKGEHSAILKIEKCHKNDRLRVNELNQVIVVSYEKMISKC